MLSPEDMPDVMSYFTDEGKMAETQQFMHRLQFLLVHNNMDVAALDVSRRCHCAVATSAPSAPNVSRLAASCTGCI